jgi:hypothetical protein
LLDALFDAGYYVARVFAFEHNGDSGDNFAFPVGSRRALPDSRARYNFGDIADKNGNAALSGFDEYAGDVVRLFDQIDSANEILFRTVFDIRAADVNVAPSNSEKACAGSYNYGFMTKIVLPWGRPIIYKG